MAIGIRPYTGLFGYTPHALHMDGPPCGYNCAYCFTRGKRKKLEAIKEHDVIYWRQYLNSRTGWTDWFLKHKKIVLASNTCDPFSTVHRFVRPLMQACLEENIPLAYQTKGGPEGLPWARTCPKANWYVTITSDDEAFIGNIESAAPKQAERMRLVEELCALGHTVSVGINPAVPAWWRDIPAFLRWTEKVGVCGLVIHALHLNNDLTAESAVRLGSATCKLGRGKAYPDTGRFMETRLPICHWSNTPWDFWETSERVYPASAGISTVAAFWKSCAVCEGGEWFAEGKTLAEYLDFMLPGLPDTESKNDIHNYCGAGMARDKEALAQRKSMRTMRDLLSYHWNSKAKRLTLNDYSEITGHDSAGSALRRYRPPTELTY